MTQEQYNKAIEISHKIESLEGVNKEINYPNYDHKLAYIELSQIGHNNDWRPCRYIGPISDILDKYDKMIRQEIKDRIEEFKKQIEEI